MPPLTICLFPPLPREPLTTCGVRNRHANSNLQPLSRALLQVPSSNYVFGGLVHAILPQSVHCRSAIAGLLHHAVLHHFLQQLGPGLCFAIFFINEGTTIHALLFLPSSGETALPQSPEKEVLRLAAIAMRGAEETMLLDAVLAATLLSAVVEQSPDGIDELRV